MNQDATRVYLCLSSYIIYPADLHPLLGRPPTVDAKVASVMLSPPEEAPGFT
jgi:hypothetical protein